MSGTYTLRFFMFCFMQGKGDGLRIERSGLHDNWDDAEGYYSKYNISIWSSLCIYVVFPLYFVWFFLSIVVCIYGCIQRYLLLLPLFVYALFLNHEFVLSLSESLFPGMFGWPNSIFNCRTTLQQFLYSVICFSKMKATALKINTLSQWQLQWSIKISFTFWI